jgi:hypothetical protein
MNNLAALIERKSIPVPESGCWLWTWAVNPRGGYGITGIHRDGVSRKAHRASFEAFNGPIPEGAHVCHKCDTPQCVNPAHLFLGDCAANNEDRRRKGRYRGEWNGRAKINAAQVREIRQKLATGEINCTQASQVYGISRTAVIEIKYRRTWSHIP